MVDIKKQVGDVSLASSIFRFGEFVQNLLVPIQDLTTSVRDPPFPHNSTRDWLIPLFLEV